MRSTAERFAQPRHRYRLAPSILTADLGRLAEEIRAADRAGVDYVHLDVMDGTFVPNLTIGPAIVEAVRKATDLPLDIHLMVMAPERLLQAFVSAGADSITVHQEVCYHLHRVIYQIKDLGARACVAVNPATPLGTIEEVARDLDMLLVMSVNPGFGGQAFIPGTIEKVRRAHALLTALGSAAEIEVDGGVSAKNIAGLADAGAQVFVTGASVYNAQHSVAESVATLREAMIDLEPLL